MTSPADYLVLSRGQWDPAASDDTIQATIDAFYAWHEAHVRAGRMVPGQRLQPQGRLVTKGGIVDGPYSEAKEVIGGYWTIRAGSLEEAAEIAAGNPCLACGLRFEIRPIEPKRASAFDVTTETPRR